MYLTPRPDGGQGWDAPQKSHHLGIGLSVHRGMEVLMTTGDTEMALTEGVISEQYRDLDTNDHSLVGGLLLGWIRLNWPGFLDRYEILSVEKEEVPLLLSPTLALVARIDVVVRDREDERVYVFNWKTSGEKKDWTLKWMNDLQTLTEALAVERSRGEPVAGVIYEGFFKGKKREDGTWTSPVANAYTKIHRSGERVWRHEYEKGWDRIPASDFPHGGQEGWINFLPMSALADNFPRSAPIFQNEEVAEDLLAQIVRWETDADTVLAGGSEADALRFFEKHPSHWNCNQCPFQKECFGRTPLEGLIETGKVVPRVEHHLVAEESNV